MLFNKKNSQFYSIQKDIYKRLSDLEMDASDTLIRKRITTLIDKVYNLKPTSSQKVLEICEEVLTYVKELSREMMNPVTLIINNYSDKIDSLLNQIKYESEEQ